MPASVDSRLFVSSDTKIQLKKNVCLLDLDGKKTEVFISCCVSEWWLWKWANKVKK